MLLLLATLVHHVPRLAGGSLSPSSPGPKLSSLLLSQTGVNFVDSGTGSHRTGPRNKNLIASSPSRKFETIIAETAQQKKSSETSHQNISAIDSTLLQQDDPSTTTTTTTSDFRFAESHYNATVPENSFASTVILPVKGKMGIWNPNPSRQIHYSILSGDPLHLFRVESRQVGDFSFLVIRVRNNERSLNREYRELYKVQVRAVVYVEEETLISNGGSSSGSNSGSNVNNVTLVNSKSKLVSKNSGSSINLSGGRSGHFLRAFSSLHSSSSSSSKHKMTFLDTNTNGDGGNNNNAHIFTSKEEIPAENKDINEVGVDHIEDGDGDGTEDKLPPPHQRFIIDDLNFANSKNSNGNNNNNNQNKDDNNNHLESKRLRSKSRNNKKNGRGGGSASDANDANGIDQITEKMEQSGVDFDEVGETTTMRKLFDGISDAVVVQNDATFSQDNLPPPSSGSVKNNNNSNKNKRSPKKSKIGDGGGRRNRRGDNGNTDTVSSSRTSRRDEQGRPGRGGNRSRARNRTGSAESRRNSGGSRGRNRQVTLLESKNVDVNENLVGVDEDRGRHGKGPPTTVGTTTSTPVPVLRTNSKVLLSSGNINSGTKKTPLLQAETLVYIRIIDVDDNQPVFESLSYDIGVNADTPVLAKVAKITAADADVGRNQEIYYR